MLPVSIFPMALIGNWDWLLATFSHWQHCPLSSGQQYQSGQSLIWSPLYVPTRTTRLRLVPHAPEIVGEKDNVFRRVVGDNPHRAILQLRVQCAHSAPLDYLCGYCRNHCLLLCSFMVLKLALIIARSWRRNQECKIFKIPRWFCIYFSGGCAEGQSRPRDWSAARLLSDSPSSPPERRGCSWRSFRRFSPFRPSIPACRIPRCPTCR